MASEITYKKLLKKIKKLEEELRQCKKEAEELQLDKEKKSIIETSIDPYRQRETEEELRKKETLQELVLKSLPMVFYVSRPYGETIDLWVSDQVKEITGFSLDDFKADPDFWETRLHPADLGRVQDETEVQKKKGSSSLEYRWRIADGSYRWFLDQSVVISDEKGNPVEIIGTWLDITDRKQAEEERKKMQLQLQQGQKMEAIGTLASGIAHDFNNILSGILGFTQLARLKVHDPDKLRNYLEEIYNGGIRAKDLVKQILTFSRQAEQEMKPLQLKLILKETLKFIRASLPMTIDIQANIISDSLIMGDPTQIHQVMINLCTNAGHAMQETGGTLEVILEDKELNPEFASGFTGLEPGAYVKLSVSDTGCGMTKNVLARIFEPFFTTKSNGEGTGLGLSVVHGIVRSHAGAIYVYSEEGKGTTVQIFLPVIEKTPGPREDAEKEIPIGSERILFIDDERPLAEGGKQLLRFLGYQVTAKTDCVKALELFKAQPDQFDLVITDMTMPKMTGYDLAVEILAVRPDIALILCTGFSTKVNREKALEKGFQAIIMKPILLRELAFTIRDVLDKK
jgi:PAS domain S-box-containing protein